MPNRITTPDEDVTATQGQKRYNDFATATDTLAHAKSIDADTTTLIANTDEVEGLIRSTNSALSTVNSNLSTVISSLSAISSKLDTIIANQG